MSNRKYYISRIIEVSHAILLGQNEFAKIFTGRADLFITRAIQAIILLISVVSSFYLLKYSKIPDPFDYMLLFVWWLLFVIILKLLRKYYSADFH